MLLTPAQIKLKSFQSRRNFFFTRGGCVSCLRACLGARLLPQSFSTQTFRRVLTGRDANSKQWFTTYFLQEAGAGKRCSECGRDGGQLREDKECPFRGVTKVGRVWRKVPESDARSVRQPVGAEGAEQEHCLVSSFWCFFFSR